MIKEIKNLLKEKRFSFIGKLHKEFSKVTVFLVGGAVRDILLNSKFKTLNSKQIQNPKSKIQNIPAEDLDFVVEGIGRDELEKFLESQGIVKDVESRAFGVFVFLPKQQTANSKQQNPSILLCPEMSIGSAEDIKILRLRQKDYLLKMISPAEILRLMPWRLICELMN